MRTGDWFDRAKALYERAVFDGDNSALATAEEDLNLVEANLALARGRIMHARFLAEGNDNPDELTSFARAAQLSQAVGDQRGEGESLFWIGCYHQVVRHDNVAAVPVLERSCEVAARVDDKLTLSYALRHLGIAEHAAGRLDAARKPLEESLRLRREIQFLPGVAANLVGLAYIAAGEGRHQDALAMLEEARAIAETSGAHGVMRSVEEARLSLRTTS